MLKGELKTVWDPKAPALHLQYASQLEIIFIPTLQRNIPVALHFLPCIADILLDFKLLEDEICLIQSLYTLYPVLSFAKNKCQMNTGILKTAKQVQLILQKPGVKLFPDLTSNYIY